MDKEFYTVKELATLLAVNPVTIYRLAKRGALPVYRIGSVKRFRREDIEDYLQNVRTFGDAALQGQSDSGQESLFPRRPGKRRNGAD